MATPITDERTVLSDRAVSYLRTIVPVLWGSLVATTLRVISPHLPGDVGQALADLLESELALSLVTAAGIAGWYWVWRRLERRIPDWLVRLVLGSARTPGYALPGAGEAGLVEVGDGRGATVEIGCACGAVTSVAHDAMGLTHFCPACGRPLEASDE